MSELEFVPTSELIDELMQRETFVGVIIYSPEEDLGTKNNFHLKMYATPNRESTTNILQMALDQLSLVE